MSTDELRPNYRTVRRPSLAGPPMAEAAADATCACGAEVLEHQPIVCVGAVVDQGPDGRRVVDLSASEWRCQRCAAGEVAA